MADLITAARAKYNLDNLTTTAAEDDTLAALVSAVSAAVERYCRRAFAQADRDELYAGGGGPVLVLDAYPVTRVDRVSGNPVAVLRVANTDPANQRATAAVTSDGLTLVRVASGVSASDSSVTWAANPTLGDIAGAVSALGGGWSAEAVPGFEGHASADLFAPQGALDAKARPAEVVLHSEDVGGFDVDADRGWLVRRGGVWGAGRANYRVRYTAGYATVPEDVQEAAAQWVAELFWQTKANPGVAPLHPPPGVRRLLEPWRRFRV